MHKRRSTAVAVIPGGALAGVPEHVVMCCIPAVLVPSGGGRVASARWVVQWFTSTTSGHYGTFTLYGNAAVRLRVQILLIDGVTLLFMFHTLEPISGTSGLQVVGVQTTGAALGRVADRAGLRGQRSVESRVVPPDPGVRGLSLIHI